MEYTTPTGLEFSIGYSIARATALRIPARFLSEERARLTGHALMAGSPRFLPRTDPVQADTGICCPVGGSLSYVRVVVTAADVPSVTDTE